MGGGMACYIKNTFKSTILSISSNETLNEPEYIITKTTLPSMDTILLASIYRRPKGILFNVFVQEFCKHYPTVKNVVVTGDLNCNLLSKNFEATYLRDMIDSLALHLQPSPPAHHTASSDTWLDVILVDDLKKIHTYTKSESPFIAGHDLISINYNIVGPLPTKSVRHRRNYHQLDQNEFNCLIRSDVLKILDKFDTELQSLDVEQVISELNDSIISHWII